MSAPRSLTRATPQQLCGAFQTCPTLHPVYRRLLKLTLEELWVIEDQRLRLVGFCQGVLRRTTYAEAIALGGRAAHRELPQLSP